MFSLPTITATTLHADGVDAAISATLNEHAIEIRKRIKRAANDIYEIGRRLTEAKKHVGYGNWLPWLEREFGWTDRTALNFIHAFEMFHMVGKSETISDLPTARNISKTRI